MMRGTSYHNSRNKTLDKFRTDLQFVEGESDARVLAEGLGDGGGKAAAMEGSGGGEQDRREGREGFGAAAV